MATRGFEFAYYIDGSQGTPVIRDWPMVADTAGYLKGDLLVITSSGLADKAAASATTVFAVCQENDTGSVAASTNMKISIVTRNQIWRCSADASSFSNWVKIYTTAGNVVDHNTIDADGHTGGCLILVDSGTIAGDTNKVGYVSFNNTNLAGTS